MLLAMLLVGLAVAWLCATGPAEGQQYQVPFLDYHYRYTNPNRQVVERLRPEVDQPGIRQGTVFIFPSLNVGSILSDNVFATPHDRQADIGLVVAPTLKVRTELPRHALEFHASGESASFLKERDNDYQDGEIGAGGQLDISHDQQAGAMFNLFRRHEDRGNPNAAGEGENGTDLTLVYGYEAMLRYGGSYDRLSYGTRLGSERFEYHNDDFDIDDRDRLVFSPGFHLQYELTEQYRPFIDVTWDHLRYDDRTDTFGNEHTGERYTALLGAEVNIATRLFGTAAIGYSARTYAQGLHTDQGLAGQVNMAWNVTLLTTLVFDARSSFDETSTEDVDRRAGSNYRKAAGVEIQHELVRNILLLGRAGYEREDFTQIDRHDNTVTTRAGLRWLMNRHAWIEGGLVTQKRWSTDDGAEFLRNIIRIGATAQF